MNCPVCAVELKITDRQGIEIDYCPNCRGVWLDRGELDKLIERVAFEGRSVSPPRAESQSNPKPKRRRDEYDDDDDYDPRYEDRRRRRRGSFLDNLFDFLD